MVHQTFHSFGYVTDKSRSTPLVGNNTNRFTVAEFIGHQLQDVTVLSGQRFPIHHYYADDGIVTAIFTHALLTFQLGDTIIIDRIRGVLFGIQTFASTVKNKIGRKMDEPAAVLLAGMRQMLYGYDIGCTGLTVMRFTKIGQNRSRAHSGN